MEITQKKRIWMTMVWHWQKWHFERVKADCEETTSDSETANQISELFSLEQNYFFKREKNKTNITQPGLKPELLCHTLRHDNCWHQESNILNYILKLIKYKAKWINESCQL